MDEGPQNSQRAQFCNQCDGLEYSDDAALKAIETLDRYGSFDAPSGELSFAFVSKEEICNLHERFMSDPTPTDVITFEGDPSIEQAGEVCVCPEVAHEYSQSNHVDFSKELTLYIIHGYLHLAGFDDIDDIDRTEMRKAEMVALDLLEAHNAIPLFRLRLKS